MSKKKGLILSLMLVLIVGLSIVAGTFAYFQWQAAVGTNVNVTIEMGGIKMHIEPEETGFVGLYPTVHCLNNVRYGDTLVRIENNTGALAIPSFKLKVAIDPSVDNTGKLDDYKEHIHYAVVALETTKTGAKKMVDGEVVTVGGNVIDNLVTGTCKAPLSVTSTSSTDDTFKSDNGNSATGLFNVITAEDTFADTPFLPREYNSTTGGVQGVTFRGEAYSTSYQWYRVYVWMDEGYTTTIVGDTVSDPLQNATFKVTWSENSMLQQVSGVSNVETGPEAGLYDNDGNMVKTWQQLLDEGDIVVEDNVITSCESFLTGKLVIAEGVTRIGDYAFYKSDLTEVFVSSTVTRLDASFAESYIEKITFASNSSLQTIGDYAFSTESLISIEIPSGVTSIGSGSISGDYALSVSFKGTMAEWNEIEKREELNNISNLFWIKCVDGIVKLRDFGLYGDSYISWTTLINDESITATNNVITNWDKDLNVKDFSYDLIVPDVITSVGSSAFYSSEVRSIIFSPDSNLSRIEENAFSGSEELIRLEIPSSLTYIGSSAFEGSHLRIVVFDGTMAEWNSIEKENDWNSSIELIEVYCLDGIVEEKWSNK